MSIPVERSLLAIIYRHRSANKATRKTIINVFCFIPAAPTLHFSFSYSSYSDYSSPLMLLLLRSLIFPMSLTTSLASSLLQFPRLVCLLNVQNFLFHFISASLIRIFVSGKIVWHLWRVSRWLWMCWWDRIQLLQPC